MYWQFNPYAVLILLGLIPLIYFAYRTYHQPPTLAGRLFMGCAIAAIGTLSFYLLELLSADPQILVLWVKIRFISGIFVPPMGLLFVLAYLGMDTWVNWKNVLLLSIVPIIRIFAVLTNDVYHLQWTDYTTVHMGNLIFTRYADTTGSAAFWAAQLYFLVLAGLMIFVTATAIRRTPGILRGQIVYFLISILLPAAGILLEMFGIDPLPNLNFPVITLCLAILPLGLALFRYRLLDLVPAAQSFVLQSMQDAVLVLDLHGRIVQANPAAIALRNVPAEAIIGRASNQVFSDVPHLVERFDKVFDVQEIIEVKDTDSQSMRYFDLRISPLQNTDKQVTGRILVLRDVTAHRRAEEQAIDLALERERTQLLKSFISDTSHDIMTPISAMRISTYLLRALADKISLAVAEIQANPQDAAVIASLETTVNAMRDKSTNLDASALRLQTLVEGMLEMVKLDKQIFVFTPGDLNQLAEQAVNLQRFLAEDKGIQLKLNLESGLPKIALDSNQFVRVLQNLLTNALKYTPHGGTVTVHTRRCGECVALEIQDTGEGIPANDLPHIFDRMYRVDKTRTTESGGVGLGLGLAIVKTIVAAHQGTVEVESTEGVGSIFRVVVPAIIVPQQPDLPKSLQIA